MYFDYFSPNVDPRSVMSFPSSDSSVDLDESFKMLLEKRRKKFEKESMEKQTPVSTKKHETAAPRYPKTPLVGRLDDTEEESILENQSSEETFMRLEAMCEYTLDISAEDTQEEAALDRLLKNSQFKANTNHQKPNFEDDTQLGDIEAPSMMWEQTMFNMNSPKPSPMKMMHLLRPSTIIEESTIANTTNNSTDSQSMKFDSLSKPDEDKKKDILIDSLENKIDDIQDIKKEEWLAETLIVEDVQNCSLPCSAEASVVVVDSESEEECEGGADEATGDDIHELQKPVQVEGKPADIESNSTKEESKFECSTTYESFLTAKGNSDTTENTYYSAESTLRPKNLTIDTDVFPKKKHTFFEDSFSTMSTSSTLSLSNDVSQGTQGAKNSPIQIPEFNDTFEEMEFMMTQGMKLVEKQGSTTNTKTKILVPKQRNSPATPRPKMFSPLRTPNFNNKGTSLFAKQTTPNTFKKPLTSATRPTASKAKKFQHIQSPIQQYIKNTPQFPLQSKLHGPTGLINELGNRNTRETQYFGNENAINKSPKAYESVVPCKGAIAASKTRRIDERTPIRIPGGDKVNKLIGNNTPVVIKHEGRFKSTEVHRDINADDTVDDSLQNLSVTS